MFARIYAYFLVFVTTSYFWSQKMEISFAFSACKEEKEYRTLFRLKLQLTLMSRLIVQNHQQEIDSFYASLRFNKLEIPSGA